MGSEEQSKQRNSEMQVAAEIAVLSARVEALERQLAELRGLLGTLHERDDISFAPLAGRGPSMSSEWLNVGYALVDGADHSYTDRTDALWHSASTWLKRVAAPASVS